MIATPRASTRGTTKLAIDPDDGPCGRLRELVPKEEVLCTLKMGGLCTLSGRSLPLAMTMGRAAVDGHQTTAAPRARTLCRGKMKGLRPGGGSAQGTPPPP